MVKEITKTDLTQICELKPGDRFRFPDLIPNDQGQYKLCDDTTRKVWEFVEGGKGTSSRMYKAPLANRKYLTYYRRPVIKINE